MQYHSRIIRYALVASVGVLAACDTSNLQTAPQARLEQLVPSLALELSTPTAGSGDHIAIAIANTSAAPIGSVQGRLRFNPSLLKYRGQLRDASSNEIMVVNADEASSGTLVVAVLDPANLTRSSELVFDVIGQGYASSISFEAQEVATNGAEIKVVKANVASAFIVNSSLQAPVDAAPMSIGDWYQSLSSNEVASEPGNIIDGLKFGDTNGNGSVQLSDALIVVNVSVGGNEMIVGTDGTGANGRYDAVVAGNVVPANLQPAPFAGLDLGEAGDPLAPGVEPSGARQITLADGLAIVNESVGSLQPVVGEVIPGRPVTPVSARSIVTGNITTNTTWNANTIYEVSGRVVVTNGATLTIEAGTRIEGQRPVGTAGGSYLAVARDGKMIARGTPLQPIVMTCTLGAGETPRFKGCWGGLSVLGNAAVNETGNLSSPIVPGRAATGGCREASAEGGAGLYGGCNDDDDSGVYSYIRLEYPGFRFNAENELNGLALYGVGRATTVDHIQVHAGLDDAVEMFGGTVNLKYLLMTATSDDAFDFTFGWNGKTQFIIAQHDALDSDNGFENDNATTNFDSSPRATPTVYNVTLVGQRNNRVGVSESQNRGMLVRRGARPHYFNFIVEGFTTALAITNNETCLDAQTSTGFEVKNSIFVLNQTLGGTAPGVAPTPGPATLCQGSVTAFLNMPTGADANILNLTASTLLSPLNVLLPDFRPASATAGATPPNDGFFVTSATFIGGAEAATANKNIIPWYSGWTRGWQAVGTP